MAGFIDMIQEKIRKKKREKAKTSRKKKRERQKRPLFESQEEQMDRDVRSADAALQRLRRRRNRK